MSDVQTQLEALRRDIDEIRQSMGINRSPHDVPGDQDHPGVQLDRQLKSQLQQKGQSTGIGVMRVTVMKRMGAEASTSSGTTTHAWTAFEDLPTEDEVLRNLKAYTDHPATLSALYRFLHRFFDGQPMRLSSADLSRDLGISEDELGLALQPLLDKEIVKLKRSAENPAPQYELGFPDPLLMLLLT